MATYFTKETDPAIDFDRVSQTALIKLNSARALAGIPFTISSNYRDPQHSVDVGGSSTDAHTEVPCTAFDIEYSGARNLYLIVSSCIGAGFNRIGINAKNNHVHVDDSPKLDKQVIWLE